MAICYVLLVERQLLGGLWRDFTLAGLLGAFTTFSTFSLQAYCQRSLGSSTGLHSGQCSGLSAGCCHGRISDQGTH